MKLKQPVNYLWIFFVFFTDLFSQKLLIPMDLTQTDHLKAYGIAYLSLSRGKNVEWLLNYRGGSFLLDENPFLEREMRLRGVSYQAVSGSELSQMYATIEDNNMEIVLLEKAPKVAVYTPPNKLPWDDAVTLVLTYAEIPYDKLWDEEVLKYKLPEYDWLHLHHEDFTGQYSKFYAAYHTAPWYVNDVIKQEEIAKKFGFKKVSEEKKTVARFIRDYVIQGGFLFAMCSATETLDIALAAEKADIAPSEFDGDPVDVGAQAKLDFSKTLAFENFTISTNALESFYSDIDVNKVNTNFRLPVEDFTLFEFSAKWDPVPTMLTQNHVNYIKGFFGLLSTFNRKTIKKSITIMGQVEGTDMVNYIHGNAGKGTFTFYGGHDPEDPQHQVNDPPTNLALHKNSPGYRLILNNILFPAAKKKPQKT